MALQLRETAVEKFISPVISPAVEPQPSHDIFQCSNCFVRKGCFIEQSITGDRQTGIELKNKQLHMKDEHIFHAGDKADSIYVIQSGSIKTYVVTEDGEEQVVGFYFAGDVLGLDALGGDSYLVSAQVLETTSICQLPLPLSNTLDVIPQYFSLVSAQQAHDYNLVLMLASKNADSRVASFLVNLSNKFDGHGYVVTTFNLSMSRHDIASYLGITVETVSRTLRRFRDNEMLGVARRKVEIFDFDGLKGIAGKMI